MAYRVETIFVGEPLAAVLYNFEGAEFKGYYRVVSDLTSLGSYFYDPTKLYLDLKNWASQPSKPSIIEPPSLKLKSLTSHLRYVFLGPNETLLVIISSN